MPTMYTEDFLTNYHIPTTTEEGQLNSMAVGTLDSGTVTDPRRETSPPSRRPWRAHVLSVAWVGAIALLLLAPALAHGTSIGPYDILAQSGLTRQPGVFAHNGFLSDQIDALIPWSTLAWTEVHHGHLPLWNPYNGLGTPLAFNWQSGAFSFSSLIGYLAPLRFAYSVQLLVTLLVAGTGILFLGRALRLSILASVFAATLYELSGALVGWLGWPHAAVAAWAGWVFGCAIFVFRGGHRLRSVAGLALTFALMILAGQPEVLLMFVLALLVLAFVVIVLRGSRLHPASGPILSPSIDLGVGLLAGAFLSAPLLLPGYQLLTLSVRSRFPVSSGALPFHDATYLLFSSYDGSPVTYWFGYNLPFETAAYVGVAAVVLAITALLLRRRSAAVVAFGCIALLGFLTTYVGPVDHLLVSLPIKSFKGINWASFAILPTTFALCILAGSGLDLVIKTDVPITGVAGPGRRTLLQVLAGGFAVSGVLIAGLWVWGRQGLLPAEAHVRAESFVWPVAEVVVGLALVAVMAKFQSRSTTVIRYLGRIAGASFLLVEAGFLLTAGAPLFSSSSTPFATTSAVRSLQHLVGSSTVGSGVEGPFVGESPCDLGIPVDANMLFGVHELDDYEPAISFAYFASWGSATGVFLDDNFGNNFCPPISSLQLARLYGVSYVLEPHGRPGPTGGRFDRRLGDEDLYWMPGAASATLTPILGASLPATASTGSPVAVAQPSPGTWRLHVSAHTPAVLRLRLSDVPGWSATIDGRPLRLVRYADVMLQARVPPGNHVVILRYWPRRFTAGIILALVTALALLVALVVDWNKRRRARSAKVA